MNLHGISGKEEYEALETLKMEEQEKTLMKFGCGVLLALLALVLIAFIKVI